jgi:uncharacterized membrane protein YfcA
MTAEPILLQQMLLLLLVIGAFVGRRSGLPCLGGGNVFVPAACYGFTILGVESDEMLPVCIATSLATIVMTSARSLYSSHNRWALQWRVQKSKVPGIPIGVSLAVFIADLLRWSTRQGMFGSLALGAGPYMTFERTHCQMAPKMPGRLLALDRRAIRHRLHLRSDRSATTLFHWHPWLQHCGSWS